MTIQSTGCLRLERINCGQDRCKKCPDGELHGPYWYHYYRKGGRLRKRYVGKMLPTNLPSVEIEGGFTMDEWQKLCADYGNKCVCCQQAIPLTVDHVVPASIGGTDHIENIQPLCASCNSRKGKKVIDYR